MLYLVDVRAWNSGCKVHYSREDSCSSSYSVARVSGGSSGSEGDCISPNAKISPPKMEDAPSITNSNSNDFIFNIDTNSQNDYETRTKKGNASLFVNKL